MVVSLRQNLNKTSSEMVSSGVSDEPQAQLESQTWITAPATQSVIAALQADGTQVRFIGGCVRDALAKRSVNDIDIATPDHPRVVLKLLESDYMINENILLPIIKENNKMDFFSWKKNNALLVNKFGIIEPVKTQIKIPNLLLVPILAFDRNKYRLGYGKGFYDRYINKNLKKFNNILTVGVAFSFQKHHKLPRDKTDVKLNYVLTEKGIY